MTKKGVQYIRRETVKGSLIEESLSHRSSSVSKKPAHHDHDCIKETKMEVYANANHITDNAIDIAINKEKIEELKEKFESNADVITENKKMLA